MLISIPGSMLLIDIISSGGKTILANLISLVTIVVACECSRYLIISSFDWFKSSYKNLKRILSLVVVGTSMLAFVSIAGRLIRNYINYGSFEFSEPEHPVMYVNDKAITFDLVGSSLFYGCFTFLILLGVYELVYHFKLLHETRRERDRLQMEKMEAELQQLKGIVNPHFLFNNLNSLSSLISENPAQAEEFLNELTKVFRYLLRTHETNLTTLGQELEFIDSYFHLLETRYGKAVSLHINVDKQLHSYLLPPLTLQLLVENAVKHNRLDKENPLRIELFSDAVHRLVVRNNIQVRKQQLESTGIGLRSINRRYKMLNHESPSIVKDDTQFSVIISLIPADFDSAILKENPSLGVVMTNSN